MVDTKLYEILSDTAENPLRMLQHRMGETFSTNNGINSTGLSTEKVLLFKDPTMQVYIIRDNVFKRVILFPIKCKLFPRRLCYTLSTPNGLKNFEFNV